MDVEVNENYTAHVLLLFFSYYNHLTISVYKTREVVWINLGLRITFSVSMLPRVLLNILRLRNMIYKKIYTQLILY